MAAEALAHLGRADAIAGWVARVPRSASTTRRPRPGPLAETEWPDALGREDRFPEWLALFESEVADRPVAAVVGEWVPRLLPGTIGAATHGLIRTGHAVRGLGGGRHAAPAPRGGDRARLLGLELPGAAGPAAADRARGRAQALADLPYLPEDDAAPRCSSATGWRRWPTSPTSSNRRSPRSGGVAEPSSCSTSWRSVARWPTCATLTAGGAIGLLHAVTAPLACEMLLPWLAEEDRDAALGYAWQAVAALHVAYDVDRHDARARPRRRRGPTTLVDAASPRATSTPSS